MRPSIVARVSMLGLFLAALGANLDGICRGDPSRADAYHQAYLASMVIFATFGSAWVFLGMGRLVERTAYWGVMRTLGAISTFAGVCFLLLQLGSWVITLCAPGRSAVLVPALVLDAAHAIPRTP